MGEPLKDKGTESVKIVDLIIDLFKKQVEIINNDETIKQEGVTASLNENGVKVMKEKANELLGNEKVYDSKEIKSAVEWLKEEIKRERRICHPISNNELDGIIDQAFPDLVKQRKVSR